jgi:hypothetical protein
MNLVRLAPIQSFFSERDEMMATQWRRALMLHLATKSCHLTGETRPSDVSYFALTRASGSCNGHLSSQSSVEK